MTCPDCHYLREERAAIHQYDGKAPRSEAERMARDEKCSEHKQTAPEPIVSEQRPLL